MVLLVGIASLGSLLAGPALARVGLVPPLVGLGLVVLAGALGVIASLWGWLRYARRNDRRSVYGSILGTPALAVLVFAAITAFGFPRINDISTDPANPPPLAPHRGEAPYPPENAALVEEHYPAVKPVTIEASPESVLQRTLILIESEPDWRVAHTDLEAGLIHGVATSSIFRFEDDFTIRVRAGGDGAVVDMRSASRDGKSDLGKNAERIRMFLHELSASF